MDINRELGFKEIQELVFKEYKENGYYDMWNYSDNPNVYTEIQRIVDLAEIGLITTEVSEVLEDTRTHEYPMLLDKWGEEIADIIIRAMNFASRKGINLESYIKVKHLKNLDREKRHGKKV